MDPVAAHIANQCLLLRTRRLSRILTKIYVEKMGHHGLSVGQFSVLAAVGSQSGARATDIAPAIDLDRSTMSRELSGLLEGGLVESRPLDGRSQGLWLTDAGASRLREALPSWEAAQLEALEALGPVAGPLIDRFAGP